MRVNGIFARVALGVLLAIFLSAQTGAASYRLMEEGGYLAVRRSDGTLERTDISLALLPPSDALLIRNGLDCADKAALSRALENFCS